MYLVAIAWFYVVLMMALAEALSPQGGLLGAFFTLVLYGVLPVTVLMYIMGTPHRRRARLAAEAAERAQAQEASRQAAHAGEGTDDGRTGHRSGDGDAHPAPGARALAPAPSAGASPDGGGESPGGAVAPVRKEG